MSIFEIVKEVEQYMKIFYQLGLVGNIETIIQYESKHKDIAQLAVEHTWTGKIQQLIELFDMFLGKIGVRR